MPECVYISCHEAIFEKVLRSSGTSLSVCAFISTSCISVTSKGAEQRHDLDYVSFVLVVDNIRILWKYPHFVEMSTFHGYYPHFVDISVFLGYSPHFVEISTFCGYFRIYWKYSPFVDILCISWIYPDFMDIIRIGHITS